ncbi:uncharacterized protein ANIA_02271 [Aspergillus nidulans FGSC A4]|uniref:Nonsense-mediated mRNA decay factor n=1 Tax=Emericella nidulans (strain FGSC A4 / ATCC 38163 / CBS 112.46 / NRRL 194 / M139) TaxID=227321 RepID=C8VMW9_EMENI|nr:hypothetical protein [Aspergillus nidulans FGSC A4]CBF86507.1 TPA: conserved hypothetical protein [Aspergillus nidulans FGSC A4]
MALTFQNAWQSALNVEKALLNNLAEKEPTFAEISHNISELRTACQNAILQDFETARSIDVEGRLWDAHLKINTRFRKLLSRFRDDNEKKKKPVERRKFEKHYLEFIKSSQRFYRGYIQQLASHFGGISELEKVARKFNFDDLSAAPPIQTSESLRKSILRSCHATLVRLGDLSRYRETELVSKERNWGPAIGYYDLASVIYPASGASHNQLAVIALADANHLKATYHLYRALSAQEPHPTARGNLEIEFRKVLSLWAKGELIRRDDAGTPGRSLAPLFVYLHAQCYRGVDFPEHDELESEVLNQLAVDLKERSLEGILQKFCLINIAAEDSSRTRSDERPKTNAHLFFQRINVKTYFTLLQILLAEVERFVVEDSSSNNSKNKVGADKITVVVRRILPALRNYSSWLLTVSNYLVAYKEKDTPLAVQLTEFWKIYANTLTLLASTFDVVHLPEVDYLLEEDEETLCFMPLSKGATSRRYLDVNGQRKPSMNDPGIERNHPNIEMLSRIREFVIDGLDLVVGNKIPVALVDDEDKKTFIYKEDGLPSQFFASPTGHHHSLSTASIEREDIRQVKQEANYQIDARSTFGGSQSASVSMSAAMNGIVEGVERLVESDTYENAPVIPNRSFDAISNTVPRDDKLPARQTPVAPPGLGPPMTSYSAALPQVSSSQSFTPQAAIPGLPTIWSTGTFSPEFRDVSSHTASGLGLLNAQGPKVTGNANSPGLQYVPESAVKSESISRQSLFAESQLEGTTFNNGPVSPFLAPSMYHQRFSGSSWDRDGIGAPASQQQALPRSTGFGLASQPMSSGFTNNTWANNAFIGSTITSGYGSYPGLDDARKTPSAQYGAIGQSPRLGQSG